MSGPASPGQQVCTGKRARSTSAPSHTISWHGADFLSFGAICITCMNRGRVFCHASFRPFGGSGSLRNASSLPTSRNAATDSSPMPSATRVGVPNRLPSTGIRGRPPVPSKPFGCSNSSAGPPAFSTRSQISVISSRGSTSATMRFNSPRRSSCARKSRRSAYFMARNPVGVSSTRSRQFTVPRSRLRLPPTRLPRARFVRLGATPKRFRYSSAKVVELPKAAARRDRGDTSVAALKRVPRMVQPEIAHMRHRA